MKPSNSGPVTELELLAFLTAARIALGLSSEKPVEVYHPLTHLEAVKNSQSDLFQNIARRAWLPGTMLPPIKDESLHLKALELAVNACLLWLSLHRDWSEWEKETAEELKLEEESEAA